VTQKATTVDILLKIIQKHTMQSKDFIEQHEEVGVGEKGPTASNWSIVQSQKFNKRVYPASIVCAPSNLSLRDEQ
jgi:hypothetical protein